MCALFFCPVPFPASIARIITYRCIKTGKAHYDKSTSACSWNTLRNYRRAFTVTLKKRIFPTRRHHLCPAKPHRWIHSETEKSPVRFTDRGFFYRGKNEKMKLSKYKIISNKISGKKPYAYFFLLVTVTAPAARAAVATAPRATAAMPKSPV